jgi:phospholipid/cholesterol/gamma-HCH transport system ATP-binding protein
LSIKSATSGRVSTFDSPAHSMEVRDVHKAFGSFKVLQGLNLTFQDDAITTILGPSGTGKSVLIKHLVGLLEPDHGDVMVFGRNLWEISEKERYDLRTRMGVLFQDGALFGSLNVREIVMKRLTEVGLEKSWAKLPNEVSGGMRKRAGFARALVMDPSIVFFDEPDSGLDPVRTSLLNDLILDMHAEHKGTYLLVTHDIRTARKVSDYVGLIWKGKVVHYGDAEEAFASEDPFVRQFLSGESAGPLGMD